MTYEWDEQKNEINIAKHSIDFADAHRIFLMPMLIALDDRFEYGEDRWVGLGLLNERIVKVVYAEPDEDTRQHSMNEASSNSSSRTNWERFDALTDDEIDTKDSPPLGKEFFAKAKWLLPGEGMPRQAVKIELELDPETLAWFQSQGQDYERRMGAALRLYAEAHQATA